MSKFRKKPIVIEAVRYVQENLDELLRFLPANVLLSEVTNESYALKIRTLEGDMLVRKGDWIIKGVAGEFYPCKPDIFDKTYEPVDPEEAEESIGNSDMYGPGGYEDKGAR